MFDIQAMLILAIIYFWYFNEKRVPLKSHRIFLVFVTVVFAATGMEIVATEIASSTEAVQSVLLYNILNLRTLAINFVPIIFSYYLLAMVHININSHKVLLVFYSVSIGIELAIIALNPIKHWAFTIQDGSYQVLTAGIVLYAIGAIMVLMCFLIIVQQRQVYDRIKGLPMALIILCGVAACVIQFIHDYLFANLVLALICMTIYHYQQSSGRVIDSVTGQFSRRFMGEYLASRFAQNKGCGLVVVAMDDFKFVNKTYGVESGDHLLYQVGQFLSSLKRSAIVFRFGSDQFCVVSKKSNHLEELADAIQERFLHPWYAENQTPIMMSASVCCISCPEDAENYGELIEVIDYSMSVAKKTRKGLVTNANEVNLDQIKKDKAIEKAVKLAIDRDELLVYYQPIFSVTKGVYNSAEALVRLHDEELGWISPEEFIPIAEKNGLIVEMGEMILEKVCQFIRDFNIANTTVEYIDVNISPVQMLQKNFADRVKAIMEKYGVSPNQIIMEITETANVSELTEFNENITGLVDYGVTFSLDDYGSGNANIDYINHMPFKIIKIDKYIIWDSFKNSKAGITLEYTISMLNALELSIVAEGVETEEMKQKLADFGCHYMQGWFYSKAIPDVDFVHLLQNQA